MGKRWEQTVNSEICFVPEMGEWLEIWTFQMSWKALISASPQFSRSSFDHSSFPSYQCPQVSFEDACSYVQNQTNRAKHGHPGGANRAMPFLLQKCVISYQHGQWTVPTTT